MSVANFDLVRIVILYNKKENLWDSVSSEIVVTSDSNYFEILNL